MTRARAFGIVVAGLLGGALSAEASDAPLSSLQWKNRVLVVVAPSAQDDQLTAQRRIYHQNAKGMAERDIVLVEAVGDDSRSRDIRRQFAVGDKAFRVLLVGKDGNAAVSSERPIDATKLFGRVDAMPMRRDEMRKRGT
jgi:hypothetical protein